jgi:hypothetical protein
VQVGHNMLFRWFVGLAMDVTVFTKNRNRLLQGDFARRFLAAILVDPQVKRKRWSATLGGYWMCELVHCQGMSSSIRD